MFFIRAGNFIAWIATILGGFQVALGLLIAFGSDDAEARASNSRTLFGSETTGQAIDQGLYAIIFGVGLGLLAKIAENVTPKK